MNIEVDGKTIEANEQGFLCNPDDWSEAVCERLAERDGVKLYVDHWELIWYFREYYEENQTCPSLHTIIRDLGHKNERFHDQKSYEKHVYSLFPKDAVHEVCKLAGLPMPPPDT